MSKDISQKLEEMQTVMRGGIFQPWSTGLGKVCVAQHLSGLEHSPAVQADPAAPGASPWIRGSPVPSGMAVCIQTSPANSVLKMVLP